LDGAGGQGSILTGDTILGRGTTVITSPDGSLAHYFGSLERLIALGPLIVLPGHGPYHENLATVASAYREHRRQRLRKIRAAALHLAASNPRGRVVTASDVADLVYVDVPSEVRPAAEMSVASQLTYLAETEEAAGIPGWGERHTVSGVPHAVLRQRSPYTLPLHPPATDVNESAAAATW
jgi:glyoxylase-like metal-dependent hydrolase (beta-lactamase superfamily II)